MAKFLIYFIVKTCRFHVRGAEHIDRLREQDVPIIYAYWHRHIFVTIYRFRKTGARPLISLSKDGELVAQIAEEFGMEPVRGSSSRGGARAFLELINTVKKDKSEVLITADGPKGPVCQIKDGTLSLAQKTGSVIVPLCWHASRVKVFEKTWDKFKIPKLFGKIIYAYGEPFHIPPNTKKEDYEQLKQKLKHQLDTLEQNTIRSFN